MHALVLIALWGGTTAAVGMPPPPAGMRELTAVEQAQLLVEGASPERPRLPPPPAGMRELTAGERLALIEAASPLAPIRRLERFDASQVADRYDIPDVARVTISDREPETP